MKLISIKDRCPNVDILKVEIPKGAHEIIVTVFTEDSKDEKHPCKIKNFGRDDIEAVRNRPDKGLGG